MLSRKHDLTFVCLESNHSPGYVHQSFMVLQSPARTLYLNTSFC